MFSALLNDLADSVKAAVAAVRVDGKWEDYETQLPAFWDPGDGALDGRVAGSLLQYRSGEYAVGVEVVRDARANVTGYSVREKATAAKTVKEATLSANVARVLSVD